KAAIDDGAEVALVEIVRRHRVEAGALELIDGERNLHPINLGAVEEAAGVIIEPENGRALVGGVVAADAFEETGAVVNGVGQHVNLRVREVNEPSVHPDLFDFFERHAGPPGSVDCCSGRAPSSRSRGWPEYRGPLKG